MGNSGPVAEDVLVERRVEQIRSGVAAHRRPPRQGDCDRRLGLRGRRRDSSAWKETRDPNLHRAGHGSSRVRMEAGREAETGEHDCGRIQGHCRLARNLTHGTGFSKTLLRRKNIVKRGQHASPLVGNEDGKKTQQKPEFSVDRGRPSHGRRRENQLSMRDLAPSFSCLPRRHCASAVKVFSVIKLETCTHPLPAGNSPAPRRSWPRVLTPASLAPTIVSA